MEYLRRRLAHMRLNILEWIIAYVLMVIFDKAAEYVARRIEDVHEEK